MQPGFEIKPVELPEELDDDESSEGTVTLEEEENDDGKITSFFKVTLRNIYEDNIITWRGREISKLTKIG